MPTPGGICTNTSRRITGPDPAGAPNRLLRRLRGLTAFQVHRAPPLCGSPVRPLESRATHARTAPSQTGLRTLAEGAAETVDRAVSGDPRHLFECVPRILEQISRMLEPQAAEKPCRRERDDLSPTPVERAPRHFGRDQPIQRRSARMLGDPLHQVAMPGGKAPAATSDSREQRVERTGEGMRFR